LKPRERWRERLIDWNLVMAAPVSFFLLRGALLAATLRGPTFFRKEIVLKKKVE
jgi:hypothetical protein